MDNSATATYCFATSTDRPLDATSDGGLLTSDGGLPWLVEAGTALGICKAFASCLTDWRKAPARSRHSLEMLVRQRVLQLACGYSGQDDADTLRTDPLFKLACGQLPLSGHDLASQPTLSRLENSVDRHACTKLALALVELYLDQKGKQGGRDGISTSPCSSSTARQGPSSPRSFGQGPSTPVASWSQASVGWSRSSVPTLTQLKHE